MNIAHAHMYIAIDPVQSTLRPTIYRKTSNHIHRGCTTSICVKRITHQSQSRACYYIWTTGSIYSITS